jgi:uncharacterized protein
VGKVQVKTNEQVENIREHLVNYFVEREDIMFSYIFGSYALGNFNSDSDIDIAIFFYYEDDIRDINKYLTIKVELEFLLKKDVDIVVLNTATPFLKTRILNKHLKICSKDSYSEALFIHKAFGEYFDIKEYIDLEYTRMLERLRKE